MPNSNMPPVPTGTSTVAIFTTLLMSGLFLLKGNTINVECVGCMYDPASSVKAEADEPHKTVTKTVTKGPDIPGVEYDCNNIKMRSFDKPPISPTITGDMLDNPDKLIPILTKLSSEQRQYIYDHERHVMEMINRHNTLCN